MATLRQTLSYSLDHPKTLRLLAVVGLLFLAVLAGYSAVQGSLRYPAAVALFCVMVLFRKWQEPYVLALAVFIFLCSGTEVSLLQEKGFAYRWHGLFLLVGVGMLRTVYEERWHFEFRPLYIGVTTWVLYMIWSSFWAWDITYSAPRAIAMGIYALAAFFAVGRYLDGGWPSLRKIVLSLAVVVFPFTAIQFLGWGNVTLDGRFQGLMSHVNGLGTVVVLAVPLALFIVLDAPVSPLVRILAGVALAVNVVLMVLGASRSCLVGAGAAVALYLLIRNPWRVLLGLATIGVTLGVLVGYEVDLIELFHLETLIRPETLATGTNRTYAWWIAWQHHLDSPIWGHGFFSGKFLVSETAYVAMARRLGFGHFHNSYLEILVDLGWLGAVPFLTFLLYLIWHGVRSYRDARGDDRYRNAVLGLGCVILAGLVHAVFESWLLQPGNITTLMFWALFVVWVRLVLNPDLFRRDEPAAGETSSQA